MKRLQCACCGTGTIGKQWFNRDTGYGLCCKCGVWIESRGGAEELESNYGKPGVHFPKLLTAACLPGELVGWETEDGERVEGVLKAWQGGQAVVRVEGTERIGRVA